MKVLTSQQAAEDEVLRLNHLNADKGCKWNIRIDWADEGYPGVLWRNVDLCTIDELTLKYDRASNTTSFTAK